MWTGPTRWHQARAGLAGPSNSADGEWAVLEPLFPPPSPVGRPRKWPLRRLLYLWRDHGLWRGLNHDLLMASREAHGREASRPAGVIDSQSVKTTQSGGPRGYGAGKKFKDRKRHILTSTPARIKPVPTSSAVPGAC